VELGVQSNTTRKLNIATWGEKYFYIYLILKEIKSIRLQNN